MAYLSIKVHKISDGAHANIKVDIDLYLVTRFCFKINETVRPCELCFARFFIYIGEFPKKPNIQTYKHKMNKNS